MDVEVRWAESGTPYIFLAIDSVGHYIALERTPVLISMLEEAFQQASNKLGQVETCKVCAEPYMQAHADAQRRLGLGQKQVYCKTCKRYQWPDELCEYAEADEDV